jgi:aldose 1-epimerase
MPDRHRGVPAGDTSWRSSSMQRNHSRFTVGTLFASLLICLPAFGASVEKKPYGTTADGKAVTEYTLTNNTGASIDILDYGGIITKLMVPDKNGKLGDVVLGCDTIGGYEKDSPYFGAIIGRVANRIAKGTYKVDGKEYHAAANNGPNSLHGGLKGYDKRMWTVTDVSGADGPALKLTLTDPDGTEGYPGTVNATVVYTFTNANVLKIEYTATTDKATPINLTNHTYWNLKDAGKSVIDGHVLKAYADKYTPVDEVQIPTGELAPVKGTPIDFTTAKPMGKDIEAMAGDPAGYDHNLVLNNQTGKLAKAVEVYEPTTGRVLEVWTTEPGLQFYSGNFLAGKFTGKDGTAYAKHSAFAFEAQKYPDAINHASFPSMLVKPGETYHQVTEYHLSVSPTQPF